MNFDLLLPQPVVDKVKVQLGVKCLHVNINPSKQQFSLDLYKEHDIIFQNVTKVEVTGVLEVRS